MQVYLLTKPQLDVCTFSFHLTWRPNRLKQTLRWIDSEWVLMYEQRLPSVNLVDTCVEHPNEKKETIGVPVYFAKSQVMYVMSPHRLDQ
jgi:hypothetical protein